jgi:RNA polymerase sigma-70 factor (ECF subfamily)
MSFAYHLTFDRAIAEDAVQEAFLRVWRFAGGFRPGNAFRPWLLRIARNLVFERGAAWRRARAPGGAPDPAVPAPAEASGEPGDREALRSALREALLGLSPPLREAFVLVRLSGRSYAEAAEALDVPEGTVKSRMAAAEEALRARLGRFL